MIKPKHTTMNLKEFKTELRMNLRSDEWGTSMEAFFEVIGHLWNRGESIPSKYQYTSGLCSDPTDTESYFHDLFINADTPQLQSIAELLHRYTSYLDFKGLSY